MARSVLNQRGSVGLTIRRSGISSAEASVASLPWYWTKASRSGFQKFSQMSR